MATMQPPIEPTTKSFIEQLPDSKLIPGKVIAPTNIHPTMVTGVRLIAVPNIISWLSFGMVISLFTSSFRMRVL